MLSPNNMARNHKITSGILGLLLYPKKPLKNTPTEPLS